MEYKARSLGHLHMHKHIVLSLSTINQPFKGFREGLMYSRPKWTKVLNLLCCQICRHDKCWNLQHLMIYIYTCTSRYPDVPLRTPIGKFNFQYICRLSSCFIWLHDKCSNFSSKWCTSRYHLVLMCILAYAWFTNFNFNISQDRIPVWVKSCRNVETWTYKLGVRRRRTSLSVASFNISLLTNDNLRNIKSLIVLSTLACHTNALNP
jgi:hypothetical protein